MRYLELIEARLPRPSRELAIAVIDACHDVYVPDGGDNPQEDLESYVESRLHGILDEISMGVVGNKLTIYRALEIADPRALVTKHLGIYWSTSYEAAHPYNAANDGAPWLRITAQVDLSHIEWITTLALHLEGGEDEVRLEPDVPVKIIALNWMTPGQPSLQRLVGRTLRT